MGESFVFALLILDATFQAPRREPRPDGPAPRRRAEDAAA